MFELDITYITTLRVKVWVYPSCLIYWIISIIRQHYFILPISICGCLEEGVLNPSGSSWDDSQIRSLGLNFFGDPELLRLQALKEIFLYPNFSDKWTIIIYIIANILWYFFSFLQKVQLDYISKKLYDNFIINGMLTLWFIGNCFYLHTRCFL